MYDPIERTYEDMAALKYKVELNESGTDTSQADGESWRDFGPPVRSSELY